MSLLAVVLSIIKLVMAHTLNKSEIPNISIMLPINPEEFKEELSTS